MIKWQLCLVEDDNFQIGGRMLHRDLGVKLPRTPQSWYPWEQGNYFILLYGWIVWNMSEWRCLMNEWVSVVWTAYFKRIFVIRNFPWTILAPKSKLRVIPAVATWAFRTTPWRWTHGFTSSVAFVTLLLRYAHTSELDSYVHAGTKGVIMTLLLRCGL